METSLWNLKNGERGQILALPDSSSFQRLQDVGFTPGVEVRALLRAPLGDPMLVAALSSAFAIRREDAEKISVRRLS